MLLKASIIELILCNDDDKWTVLRFGWIFLQIYEAPESLDTHYMCIGTKVYPFENSALVNFYWNGSVSHMWNSSVFWTTVLKPYG